MPSVRLVSAARFVGLGWWQVEELHPVDLGENDHQYHQEHLNEQCTQIRPLTEEEILEIADRALGEQIVDREADAAADDESDEDGSQLNRRQPSGDKNVH